MTIVRERTNTTPPRAELHIAETELQALIREARLRQRRRRLLIACLAATVGGTAVGAWVSAQSARGPASSRLGSALPSLAADGTCPTSPASFVSNQVYNDTVLGAGPVRLAIGNPYSKTRRHVLLGRTQAPGWWAIEAIWITKPGYSGPFVAHGTRLGTGGQIDVQPDDTGLAPGRGPLSIPASKDNTGYGFRAYPGSIWVRSSGCYDVHINGTRPNENIVFYAQAPGR